LATFETWSPEQASVRQLLARLVGEGGGLATDVGRLLGAETRARAAHLRAGGVLVAGAGGTLLVGLAVASVAAVAALALVLPLWAAALVVAAVELTLALVLARAGVARLRRAASVPERTMDVLEDGMRALRVEAEARSLGPSRRADAPPHRVGQPPS
jgi:hypothetical protein